MTSQGDAYHDSVNYPEYVKIFSRGASAEPTPGFVVVLNDFDDPGNPDDVINRGAWASGGN